MSDTLLAEIDYWQKGETNSKVKMKTDEKQTFMAWKYFLKVHQVGEFV